MEETPRSEAKRQSGACIEILVSLVEGLNREKYQPFFTDFSFINETLDLGEEILSVVHDEAEEPVEAKKFSF